MKDNIELLSAELDEALTKLVSAMALAQHAVPTRAELEALKQYLLNISQTVSVLQDDLKAHPAPEWSESWRKA